MSYSKQALDMIVIAAASAASVSVLAFMCGILVGAWMMNPVIRAWKDMFWKAKFGKPYSRTDQRKRGLRVRISRGE